MFRAWDNGRGPENTRAGRTRVLPLLIRRKVGLREPDPTLIAYPPSGPAFPPRSAPGQTRSTTRCQPRLGSRGASRSAPWPTPGPPPHLRRLSPGPSRPPAPQPSPTGQALFGSLQRCRDINGGGEGGRSDVCLAFSSDWGVLAGNADLDCSPALPGGCRGPDTSSHRPSSARNGGGGGTQAALRAPRHLPCLWPTIP